MALSDPVCEFLTFPSSMSNGDDNLNALLDAFDASLAQKNALYAAAAANSPQLMDPSLTSTRDLLADEALFSPDLLSPELQQFLSTHTTPYMPSAAEEAIFTTPFIPDMELFPGVQSSIKDANLMRPPQSAKRTIIGTKRALSENNSTATTPALPTTPSIRNLLANSPHLFNMQSPQLFASGNDEPDPATYKRQRNTEAARRSRARKLARMQTLEDQVWQLGKEKSDLEVRIAILEREKIVWMQHEIELKQRVRELEVAMLGKGKS